MRIWIVLQIMKISINPRGKVQGFMRTWNLFFLMWKKYTFTYIHKYIWVCAGTFICMYVCTWVFVSQKYSLPPLIWKYIIYCVYNIYLRLCRFEYGCFLSNTSSKLARASVSLPFGLLVLEGFALEILGFFSFQTWLCWASDSVFCSLIEKGGNYF